MNNATSLGRNIFFNVSGYAVTAVVAFVIAPISIHVLGDARYGAWTLVSELIGYYGLLDLGIRGAVTYYIARYSARNQDEAIKETIASAFWVLSACGAAAIMVGMGLTIAFPYLFRTDGVHLTEVRHSLIIMTVLIGLSLPMNVFSGGLIGKQRFDIATGADIFTRVLSAGAFYVVLKAGGGLISLALVQTAGRIAYWGLTLTACRSVLCGVTTSPAWFRMERARDLTRYGLRNAVSQVALLFIYRMDLAVVGMFVGISHVTYYSIGAMLVGYASTLCSSFTYAFTPRFTHLISCDSHDQLNRLYLFGMRVTGMIITGLVAGMLIFGKDFIRLWLGASYVSGPWTDRSDVIMTILVLANLPRMLQSISWQLLYAMAHVRFLMWLNVCEAIANMCLSLLLVRRFGPVGVALGTLFPLLASHVLVMPVYSSRTFNIPLTHLFRKGFFVPLFTGIMIWGSGTVCLHFVPPDSWKIFLLDIIVTSSAGGILCFALGFSREELRQLLELLCLRQKDSTIREIAKEGLK